MAQAGFASLAELVGASRRLAFSSETLPLALGTGPGYVPRGCGGPTLTAWDERTTLVCLAGTTMTGEAIFIGYRRDDTADVAGRLHEHLARRFGSRRVFMDVDNLRPGVDFGEYIKTVLPRCRVALRLENSINRAGQTIMEPLDEQGVVTMQLAAGSFSLHHTLAVHRSAPNRARHRRIGCGINYIPAHVRPTGPVRMAAMLVRGHDRYGHFDLYDPPEIEFDTARHDDVFQRYSENYRVQVERHERQFARERP